MQLSAILVSAFSLGVSLSISFLSLERILIIVRTNMHTRYKRQFVTVAFVSCSLTSIFIFCASLLIEWPLQTKTGKFFCSFENNSPFFAFPDCKTLQCSLGDAGFLINTGKMVIGIMNVCMCVTFYVILWRYVKGNAASRAHFKKVSFLEKFEEIEEI
jgi:hypothetical protein